MERLDKDRENESTRPSPLLSQYVYNFGEAATGNIGGPAYYSPYPTDYYPSYYFPGTSTAPYQLEGQINQRTQQLQPGSAKVAQKEMPVYTYRVRIINSKNKREFMDLSWHNMSEKFESVTNLKLKLIDSFPEYVPSSPTFQVGYLEGRGSSKRWIVCPDDLNKMYKAFSDGDEVKLWCEAKPKEDKRKRPSDNIEEPKSKKQRSDEEEESIRAELEEKHGSSYTGPQYTLWAKLLRSGRCNSYEEPPPIPLITGEKRGRSQPKKESISDAIVGAATAFAHVLNVPTSTPSPSKSTSTLRTTSVLSPNNQANLRRKYLEDLRTLSQLLNDGVLSDVEFQEQKETILTGLRKLKFNH